jgi:hypothetical protein
MQKNPEAILKVSIILLECSTYRNSYLPVAYCQKNKEDMQQYRRMKYCPAKSMDS